MEGVTNDWHICSQYEYERAAANRWLFLHNSQILICCCVSLSCRSRDINSIVIRDCIHSYARYWLWLCLTWIAGCMQDEIADENLWQKWSFNLKIGSDLRWNWMMILDFAFGVLTVVCWILNDVGCFEESIRRFLSAVLRF